MYLNTVNPLLSPNSRGLIYFIHIWGRAGEGGGGVAIEMGVLINLAETMVLVLHKKKQERKVKKLKYKKVGGQAAEDQKQIRFPFSE